MKNHMKKNLVYDISYRTLIGEKPLRVRFDKVDESSDIWGPLEQLGPG